VVVARVEGPLFYANSVDVKDRLLALATEPDERPSALVLQLDQGDLDLESLDMLGELAATLAAESIELRLASVRTPTRELLRRGGVADHVRIAPTLDAAVEREVTPSG